MRSNEHGGDIYTNAGVTLDFSVNLNPLGMPKIIKQAIVEGLDKFESYPDCECRALREGISRREGVSPENILCGNGAADLIYRMCFALRPKATLVTAPAFADYERAAAVSGGKIKYHALLEDEKFALTERILDDITDGLDMVFICSPNNPTGRLAGFELLQRIAEKCEKTGAYLIVDECFIEFTNAESIKKLMDKHENIIVLRAFTKSCAMAGLRLGYMMTANDEVIRLTSECAQPWSVSAPAQIAGLAALKALESLDEMREIITSGRKFLAEALAELGIKAYPSDANFMLIKSPKPLYEPLLKRGILIRNCASFNGLDGSYARICVKTRADNETLISNIKEIMHG